MNITGMLAIGNGEKCPFCDDIIDDDTLGHLIENHKEEVNAVLFGGKNMAKSKKQLSEEAKERLIAYNKLSAAEKLKVIRSRRGKSKKEEEKILQSTKEM